MHFYALEAFVQDKLHQRDDFYLKPVISLNKHNTLLNNNNRDSSGIDFRGNYIYFQNKDWTNR